MKSKYCFFIAALIGPCISFTVFAQGSAQQLAQDYMQAIPKADIDKMDAYWTGNHWLILWNIVSAALVAWLFLSAGIAQRIDAISMRFKNINIQVLLFAGLYFVLEYTLGFPLHFYQSFFREHQYGFSKLTFDQWISEDLATLILTTLFISILVILIYAVIRKTKQFWWLWGAGISLAFLIIGLLIFPVYIRPMFNEYKPLSDGPVKERIVALAKANNIPSDQIYVYDESKQTTRPSADVSGFAGTTRISVNDNMLSRCTQQEIVAVIAHEMVHYKMRHIYKLLAAFGLLIIGGFWFINFLFEKMIVWRENWHITGVGDIKGLPLLIFLLSLYFFLLTPVSNSITRQVEKEADFLSFDIAHEPDAFASYFVKSADYNRVNPSFWEEIFFYDHPAVKNRILSAMEWKVEHENQ